MISYSPVYMDGTSDNTTTTDNSRTSCNNARSSLGAFDENSSTVLLTLTTVLLWIVAYSLRYEESELI